MHEQACQEHSSCFGSASEQRLHGLLEESATIGTMKGWEALRVMAPDTCRPFCRDRRGMVLGEGAGVFVLEALDRAKARGAHIHAEMVGFGQSSDAGDIVLPSANGAAAARVLTSATSSATEAYAAR